MEDAAAVTQPIVRLSPFGQLYVAAVTVVALVSQVGGSHWWYVALIVLALPLSLVALWVGFYAALAVGYVVGHQPDHVSIPVVLVWTVVWGVTAWVNARMAEKVMRSGWEALRVNPRVDYELEED